MKAAIPASRPHSAEVTRACILPTPVCRGSTSSLSVDQLRACRSCESFATETSSPWLATRMVRRRRSVGLPAGPLRFRLNGSCSAERLRLRSNDFHIHFGGEIVKVAFVGKGGSGKTTLSALFVRHLAERRLPVVAVDADINQHLGVALGLDEAEAAKVPALGAHLGEIKDHLRGDNPRITSAQAMVKTTPPGRGSRLLRLGGNDPFHTALSVEVSLEGDLSATGYAPVRLMVTGPFADEDLGVACYHSKTGAVELYLNHLIDGPGEYVVVDMTAGADAFASGLFTRFDLTVLVSEPTRRGVGVYRQYAEHAAGHGVALRVLGNKVTDADDAAYLRDQVGDALIGWFGQSAWVRAAERGAVAPVGTLEPANLAVLDAVLAALDAQERDWAAYHRGTVEFHLRNAAAWGNRAVRADLAAQVDPEFVPGPRAIRPVSA